MKRIYTVEDIADLAAQALEARFSDEAAALDAEIAAQTDESAMYTRQRREFLAEDYEHNKELLIRFAGQGALRQKKAKTVFVDSKPRQSISYHLAAAVKETLRF